MLSVDFARLPAHGATWDDLDPFEFERVRRLVADSGDRADRVLVTLADQELTRALGLEVPDSEVSTGGLLLSGREAATYLLVDVSTAGILQTPTGWPHRTQTGGDINPTLRVPDGDRDRVVPVLSGGRR
jgi:hypothetical protein